LVDYYWKKKRFLLRHVVGAIDRESPLAPEITLIAAFCIGGNQCNEQPAVVDTPANLAIPSIPASQLALVEPHFDAR
jgi:hypothetical protein